MMIEVVLYKDRKMSEAMKDEGKERMRGRAGKKAMKTCFTQDLYLTIGPLVFNIKMKIISSSRIFPFQRTEKKN